MPRRLIPFAIIVLLAFVATAGSLLTNLIAGNQALTNWLKNQRWYSLRNVLLALGVTLCLTIGLEIWRRLTSDRPPESASRHFSNAALAPPDHRNGAAMLEFRVSSVIPRPGAIEFVARSGMDGRDLVNRLKEEFAAPKNPLLNLWGPGGVGKTALAAEVTRQLAPDFDGRVVWTGPELRSGFSLTTLLDEVASQLARPDLRQAGDKQKRELLRPVLAERRTLIVIDNFETIAEQEQLRCAEWLAHEAPCPALVTSRAALEAARNIQIGAMSHSEAREFMGKAIHQRANPQLFDAPILDRIASMAGFNPLVMEWITRQIDLARDPERVLSDLAHGASAVTERVFDRSFQLPRVGNAGRRALMALSLFVPDASPSALALVVGFGESLDEERFRKAASAARLRNRLTGEKKLIRKLPIEFAYVCSLVWFLRCFVAGKKPAGDADTEKLDRAITPLADLLLVKPAANKRLTVEGLTRELAHTRLAARGESRVFRRRFVDYFAHYAVDNSANTPEKYDELEKERENILTAAKIACEEGDGQITRQIFALVGNFLEVRGYWDDCDRVAELALQSARLENNQEEIARCLSGLARIREKRGELAEARKLYEEDLALARAEVEKYQAKLIGSQQGAASRPPEKPDSIGRLRVVKKIREVHRDWAELIRQAEARTAKTENEKARGRVAGILVHLGATALKQGDADGAERMFQESLSMARELNDQVGVANVLHAFGYMASKQGDLDAASRFYEESLEIFRRQGSELQVADGLNSLGIVAKEKKDFARARQLHEESLEIKKKLGAREGIAFSLGNLGAVAAASGDLTEGVRLGGEALTILEQLKSPDAEAVRAWLQQRAEEQAQERANERAPKRAEERAQIPEPLTDS
jgi:tetratricopeptide (TPR) repeat protein